MKMKKVAALSLAVAMVVGMMACGNSGGSNSTTAQENLVTAADGGTGAAAGDASYTINIGHFGSETTAVQMGCLAMKEYLEKESNGAITVNIYPNNSMGSDDELCQMVQNGNIEMTCANSIIVNYVPDAAIYDLFYNFSDIEDVKQKFMKDEKFLTVMRDVYAKAGFYLAGYSVHGFRLATANKPINSPEDLQGLTFRVMQNDYHIQGWQCMGATPTPFSFSELYTALQQGTLDAQENPVETIYSAKLYEQQKYISRTNHLQQTQQWLVNLDFYHNLPDEYKTMFDKAIAICCETATNGALEKEAEWSSEIKEFGCTFVDLTDDQREAFKEAVAPEWEAIKAGVDSAVWEAYTN